MGHWAANVNHLHTACSVRGGQQPCALYDVLDAFARAGPCISAAVWSLSSDTLEYPNGDALLEGDSDPRSGAVPVLLVLMSALFGRDLRVAFRSHRTLW